MKLDHKKMFKDSRIKLEPLLAHKIRTIAAMQNKQLDQLVNDMLVSWAKEHNWLRKLDSLPQTDEFKAVVAFSNVKSAATATPHLVDAMKLMGFMHVKEVDTSNLAAARKIYRLWCDEDYNKFVHIVEEYVKTYDKSCSFTNLLYKGKDAFEQYESTVIWTPEIVSKEIKAFT